MGKTSSGPGGAGTPGQDLLADPEGPAPPASWFLRVQRPPAGPAALPGHGQAGANDRPQDHPGPAGLTPATAAAAVRGKPSGPGFEPGPVPAAAPGDPPQSIWLTSHLQWDTAGITWQPGHEPFGHRPRQVLAPAAPADVDDYPADGRTADPPARLWLRPAFASPRYPASSGTMPPAVAAGVDEAPPGEWHYPPGAPEYSAPGDADADQDPDGDRAADPPARIRRRPAILPRRRPASDGGTLLLGPARPRPKTWRRPAPRRVAAIAVPAVVVLAVTTLAVALLTGQGPKPGQLTASQQGSQPAAPGPEPLQLGMYPGQAARGVFQSAGRIVASANTIVAIGSQASDGVTRQQFFVSRDGGGTWRLAPVHTPGGGPAPLGYPAARLAGGPAGWLAAGPQAIWTSPDGRAWTLAATHGITPQQPGDAVWVLNSTSSGFLAAGPGTGENGPQAVIWTSRDGLTWQRKTAAQLGLAAPGETVQNIAYITARGADTVISGTVAKDGTTYSSVWLSTSAGAAWTRVTVPADHGASASITGLGFDGAGLIAVRPGRSAAGHSGGVAYFSPDGRTWQYAATIGAAAGWTPSLVKGSSNGFVTVGTTTAGKLAAYTSTGTGSTWRPTAPLGDAAREAIDGATTGPAGAVVAIGSTAPSTVSQQPVFLEANTAGGIKPVPVASIPGAAIPELAVNGLAAAAGQQIAVGSANGYPAIWQRQADGSWPLVSPAPAAGQPLRALTGVTRGSAGWLAVGAPGPVVFTSANGTTWQRVSGPGSIAADLAGVSAAAAAAGPAGYVIAGKLVAPGGTCVADVWWSANLRTWTRAHDVNDANGSSQVLAVAAAGHGFVSAGSHDGKPAVWITADGRRWVTVVLPLPARAASAVLEQVAISGNRVVALGRASATAQPDAGTMPLAEVSADGGLTWQQVPFTGPGPDTAFTALTAGPAGFTAAGQFGPPGQRVSAAWTSATGTSWRQSQVGGVQPGGGSRITALAPSGAAATGISLVTSQESQRAYSVTIRPR